jgi:Glycosyltransferase sugar-binding region containing DXD motif
MIFTYWDGETTTPAEFCRDWGTIDPQVTIYHDRDVLPILNWLDPCYADTYKILSISSCKADIARFVLLYYFGGVYLDSHVGSNNLCKLAETLGHLARFDLVVFDDPSHHSFEGDLCMYNGALCARQAAPVLMEILGWLFGNLWRHLRAEQATSAHVPYDIFVLTGAWAIAVNLFDYGLRPIELRPQFSGLVMRQRLAAEQWPFAFHRFYAYRQPGMHWSERQKAERLFRPASPARSRKSPMAVSPNRHP